MITDSLTVPEVLPPVAPLTAATPYQEQTEALRPYVLVSKRCLFSSAHHYWNEAWSGVKNEATFHACSNRYGHGHNYQLTLTVGGAVSAETAMVINLNDLKALLKQDILAVLDHKYLNHQVPFFKHTIPTLENLARFCWQQLQPGVEALGLRLENLYLEECDGLGLLYTGPSTSPLFASSLLPKEKEECSGLSASIKKAASMLILKRRYHFSAAHRLHNPEFSDEQNQAVYSKCNNPNGHGHNYELELMLSGEADIDTGMLIDLAELDMMIEQELIEALDHKHLNFDVPFLAGINPTAENIAVVVYHHLKPLLPKPELLYGVKIIESRNNSAEYYGNQTPVVQSGLTGEPMMAAAGL